MFKYRKNQNNFLLQRLICYTFCTSVAAQTCQNASELEFSLDIDYELNPDNTILLDFFDHPQPFVNKVLNHYSQIRDIHTHSPLYAAVINFANLISKSKNATLISVKEIDDICPEELERHKLFRTIFPVQTLATMPNIFLNHSDDKVFVPMAEIPSNFAYCDRIQKADEHFSIIVGLFQNTADYRVWICLSSAIVSIGFILKLNIEEHGNIHRLELSNIPVSLSILSVLISPATSSGSRLTNYSCLFVLWTLVATIFSVYYSGVVTGETIEPPPDIRIETLTQLIEANYSFMFDAPERQQVTYKSVHLDFQLQKNRILQNKLLERIRLAIVMKRDWRFSRELAKNYSKYATIADWGATINYASQAQESFKSDEKKSCFIGKKLLFPFQLYYVFTGPGSIGLARAFQILVEAGMLVVWQKEYYGSASSLTVQGRSRVISPTNIVENDRKPAPLELNGKLLHVFFLWMICLLFTLSVFGVEIIKSFLGRHCCMDVNHIKIINLKQQNIFQTKAIAVSSSEQNNLVEDTTSIN